MLQLDRVATARGGDPAVRAQIESLVKSHIELPQFNLFGEERVNVLKLNLALDSLLER
jgi:K+-transporting ATPase ATPase C chain